MKISIIDLAAEKIKLRSISEIMLHETIKKPDQTVEGYGGRTVKQKIYNLNNKSKLLRVVYEINNQEIIIITAYLTSQIKKYWR